MANADFARFQEQAHPVANELLERGMARRLNAADPHDVLRWEACSLALRFEGYLNEIIEPRGLGREAIDSLVPRLGPDQERSWGMPEFAPRPWALDGQGTDIGIFSIAAMYPWLNFREGYGYREHRRRHYGRRLIVEAASIAKEHGLVAARIPTDWMFPNAM